MPIIPRDNAKQYAVITADVVASRTVGSFRLKRDRKLDQLSQLHLEQKLILSPYAVTAWDEFQVILRKPKYLPRVLLDLRRLFYPFQLWIAVGMGSATGTRKQPVNLFAGGQAFERARIAADRLKAASPKYRALTGFESGSSIFDTIANTVYHLQDSLIEGITEKQWATINVQLSTDRQEITARRLRIDISTVSRNLKRGYYWQLVETVQAMERVIGTYF